ncbi:hypothetical protein OROMI_033863 [Orobanche minor]
MPNSLFPTLDQVFLLLYCLLTTIIIMTSSEASSPCKHMGHVKSTTPLITFLELLQETALTTFGEKDFDPKLYVDLSLKFNLSTVEKAFDEIKRSENGIVPAKDLHKFIGNYLDDPSKDILHYDPPDFVPEPDGFLSKVENKEVRRWALEVHSLWKNLSRKVSDEVKKHPELHTLLPLPAPAIIPGSRFREVYYWDSYWVIRGLLASKMYQTANSIVNNLLSFVNTYGYVLNGARAYYTNRSQPPLLSSMVYEMYKRTGTHKDKKFASKFLSSSQKQQFYRELASAAESGWDFSTRWMRNSSEFTSLATTSVLPVDLNVFILKMELDIVFLAKEIGEEITAKRFLKASQARKEAIDSIFWNNKMGQWLDYWLTDDNCQESQRWTACNQNQNVFASNFSPLWIHLFNSDTALVDKVKRSLQSSGLVRAAGIATSLTNSGQQWDFPNGWAPLQHMIVEGLAKSRSQEAKSLAVDIAVRWVRTNYVGYVKTGAMHEKYDVEKCGDSGGGGEYVPQTGFGWSNGVVLAFLEEFGWPQDRRIGC